MKKTHVFLIAILCLVLTVFSCDNSSGSDNESGGNGGGNNGGDAALDFRADDRISLPFAALQKLGKIKEDDGAETVSVAGCYTYYEDILIDETTVTAYLGLQLTSEGKIKSFYAVSSDKNSNDAVVWHKDSGGEVWEVNYVVGTVGEGEDERNILMISEAGGKIVGVLYYVLEDDKLVISDGTEDGSMELSKAEDGIFDDATDPTEDFYGSGTEDDPYMVGWVKTDGASINEKLEGCFTCDDFDFSGEGVSLFFGIRFELKKEDGDITEARIYNYFTRNDFVEDGEKVYSYSFDNPENKGMLCKFKERVVNPYVSDRKVTNLIIWEKSYEDDCCGQTPIYFGTDADGDVTEFWLDSCYDDWANRYSHDGDNAKYFYHYVKSADDTIFEGAFDYMDYITGDKNF